MAYVVPTVHPAAAIRGRPITDIIGADLAKGWRIAQEGPRELGNIITVLPSSPWGLQGAFEAALSWIKYWHDSRTWVAIDVETSSLDYFNCKLYSIALSGMDGYKTAVSFTLCDYHTIQSEYELALVQALREILADPGVGKIYHNAPFDMAVLTCKGFKLAGKIYDTLGGAHLMQPDIPKDLGWVAQTYLDCRAWKIGHKGQKLAFTSDPDELLYYNAEDALYTAQVVLPQMEDVYHRGISSELLHWQMRYAELATKMEVAGIPVNKELRRQMGMELLKKMHECRVWLRQNLQWDDFNPMSEHHRRDVLFGPKYAVHPWNLGLRPTRYTEKTELPSTSYKAIIDFLEHPVVRKIVDYVESRHVYATQYRENHDWEQWKLKELGFDEELKDYKKNPPKHKKGGAYERAMFDDGRIHPKWGITKGVRYTTSPNVQNTRKKDRVWMESKAGRIMVGGDKDQLELRVAACLAGVEPLLEEMAKPDGDPHTMAAIKIYGEEFTSRGPKDRSNLRDMLKNTVYASLYEAGLMTVWKTIRERKELPPEMRAALTVPRVSQIYHGYFGLYPEFHAHHEAKVEQIRQKGFISHPPFGRTRYFPIFPPPYKELSNWDIQGAGAEFVTSEMAEAADELMHRHHGRTVPILHLHDQPVFETDESLAEETKAIVEKHCGGSRLEGPKGSVILTLSCSIARNVKEAK